MKKLIAVAGIFALAACGGDAEEPATDDGAMVEEPGAAPAVEESAAGTYTGETEDGGSFAFTLNPDGTFTDSQNGELVATGTWTQDPETGVCLVDDGALDPTPACFQMGEVSDDGTVAWTGPDGEEFTMQLSQ